MPGGNLLIWSRLDPSVEERSSEDGKAVIGVFLVDAANVGQDGDD